MNPTAPQPNLRSIFSTMGTVRLEKDAQTGRFCDFPPSLWDTRGAPEGVRGIGVLNAKGLLAMTYSPRRLPSKYHRR